MASCCVGADRHAILLLMQYYSCQTPECGIVFFADRPFHYFDNDDLIGPAGIKQP